MKVSYVYPNVSELNRRGRGGLATRSALAKQTGCELVEVPCDFIKNKTEVELTGLGLGAFLDERAIEILYEAPGEVPTCNYVLHTEPSLPRTDGYGLNHQSPLRWHDQAWVESLIGMMISVSNHLKHPAEAIEIHPGDRRNSSKDIILGCQEIHRRYQHAFNKRPLILLENRTGQFISKGTELAEFWDAVTAKPGVDRSSIGIVLDIQQLYTVSRRDFIKQFSLIPLDAIKGIHVHAKHRTPTLRDDIPWKFVFDRLRTSESPLLVNPEIHHLGPVPDALEFCHDLLKETKSV